MLFLISQENQTQFHFSDRINERLAAGCTRHFHLDHLGTPRLVSNNLGQQAAYHVYYPFGEEATAFNQDVIREKFTGHERDLGNPGGSGDDLDYMHARHESEWTGRFLGMDRHPGKPRIPQSWNRYTYVQGNPLKYVDPNGQDTTGTYYGGASFTSWNDPAWAAVFGGAVLVGGVTLGVEGGAVAEATTLGEGLTLLGIKFQGAIDFLRNIGAGLTDTPSVKTPISGDLARQFDTAKGSVSLLATAKTEGTALFLQDSAVYGDKAKVSLGASGVFDAIRQLATELQGKGYTTIVIQGLRYSGAKPGSNQQVTIDIAKFLAK